MSAVVQGEAPRIRPMREADVREVMAIERRMYPFPWTERIFRDCLRVGYACRVAEMAGRLAGYGVMSSGAGEAHILNLCIDADCQRRGLGRQLMLYLLEEAAGRAADTVFLEVRPSNVAALRLYEELGFNRVGTRKAYYPAQHGREDAAILALTLAFPLE